MPEGKDPEKRQDDQNKMKLEDVAYEFEGDGEYAIPIVFSTTDPRPALKAEDNANPFAGEVKSGADAEPTPRTETKRDEETKKEPSTSASYKYPIALGAEVLLSLIHI